MHFIYNLIILAIFIFLILYIGAPNISNNHYIYHKVIIFILVFIFQFALYIISDFYDRKFTIKEIAVKTLIISAACIIGYSIFNDLIYSKTISTNNCDYKIVCANVTFIMIISILLVKIMELIVSTNHF
jgi:hypothetical protein